jgi:DNA processing protein
VTSTLDERSAWVVLASVPGIGEVTFSDLVGRAGGAARVLEHARADRLDRLDRPKRGPAEGGRSRARRLDAALRQAIEEAARAPEQLLERLASLGLWTLTPLDQAYPRRLRDLDPVPPVLYGWGEAAVLAAPRSVAMVGTRRPTAAGRLLAARLASALVGTGVVVISGMAIGIDGAAHAATVENGGITVAVLGGGHAHPGPRAHAALLKALLAGGGCVVSELPPDALPTRGTFPRRNRIISALADAVVVVEAPLRSGALITARHALEQGRPLFVAPGGLARPRPPAAWPCCGRRPLVRSRAPRSCWSTWGSGERTIRTRTERGAPLSALDSIAGWPWPCSTALSARSPRGSARRPSEPTRWCSPRVWHRVSSPGR